MIRSDKIKNILAGKALGPPRFFFGAGEGRRKEISVLCLPPAEENPSGMGKINVTNKKFLLKNKKYAQVLRPVIDFGADLWYNSRTLRAMPKASLVGMAAAKRILRLEIDAND